MLEKKAKANADKASGKPQEKNRLTSG